MSPSGFYFELGWSSKGDEDIESAPQTTYQGVSLWGHKPQDRRSATSSVSSATA